MPYFHPEQYNLFAFCNNNPANDRDDDGQLSWLAKIANGGALLKFGNNFGIYVGSNTLLHMHLPIDAGIYGGLK